MIHCMCIYYVLLFSFYLILLLYIIPEDIQLASVLIMNRIKKFYLLNMYIYYYRAPIAEFLFMNNSLVNQCWLYTITN